MARSTPLWILCRTFPCPIWSRFTKTILLWCISLLLLDEALPQNPLPVGGGAAPGAVLRPRRWPDRRSPLPAERSSTGAYPICTALHCPDGKLTFSLRLLLRY